VSVTCDISRNDQVEAAVNTVLERFEHIDILVNNAGATWGAPLAELPFEAWDKVVRTNVDGTYFVSRAVALHMIERGAGGRIINIASIAGLLGTDPRIMPTLPYNTSKGAVVNFTRALAATLAEHNITVNCICPGFFPTKMTAGILGQYGEEIVAATPLDAWAMRTICRASPSCLHPRPPPSSPARSSPSTAARPPSSEEVPDD